MARARKCDRCGALYERPMDARRNIEIIKDSGGYTSYQFDLCDNCQNKLINWLNEFKINVIQKGE